VPCPFGSARVQKAAEIIGKGVMNLLCTTVGDVESLEFQNDIAVWKSAGQIVELLPIDRLAAYLRLDRIASLALIDAIVCAADTDLLPRELDADWIDPIQRALKLAEDVGNLPENCAMRDGRKWKRIPFVILCNSNGLYFEYKPQIQHDTQAHILTRNDPDPCAVLKRIQCIVDEYHDRVLEQYRKLGFMIRFKHGRAQIRPALKPKRSDLETDYYYAQADRRNKSDWVTVKRDIEGIRLDVELFQSLIDRRVNETEMHRFLEEHPAILMEACLGIPISHRPTFSKPTGWTPDFALAPILGPLVSHVELMELKGPSERMLSGKIHRGFSSKVIRAIDQVRDYDRCLRDPANVQAIEEAFGYLPASSKLAVLIGRAPSNQEEREILERRRGEINVKVITYDEILQTQSAHINWLSLY
jgi:hypothetical protein